MATIDTAMGRIGFIEARPDTPSGLPLLCLHGVGSDKSAWQPQLDHFGSARRTVAADYPGYGESDFMPGAGHDDYARAMVALLDALEIDRAHVCGLSLGGVVAIAMAALAPERVAGLIFADSFAVHPEGQAIHDRSLGAARSIGMRALAEARVDHLLGIDPPAGLREEVVETMAAIPLPAYELGAAAVWLADQQGRAAAITHDTLILCGEEDSVTPPELSRKLKGLISGARISFIPEAGHLANNERPGGFNHEVAALIVEADKKTPI